MFWPSMKTARLGGMNTWYTHTASPPLILTANVKALQPSLDMTVNVTSTKLQNKVLRIAMFKVDQLLKPPLRSTHLKMSLTPIQHWPWRLLLIVKIHSFTMAHTHDTVSNWNIGRHNSQWRCWRLSRPRTHSKLRASAFWNLCLKLDAVGCWKRFQSNSDVTDSTANSRPPRRWPRVGRWGFFR